MTLKKSSWWHFHIGSIRYRWVSSICLFLILLSAISLTKTMNQKYNSILEQFFHTEIITEYSLDKIRAACEYFGNPQDSFKSIHIAGTNGKGSVSKMIFQMLKESWKRVWVYTSPHNIDIRERFETELWLISQGDFARLAEEIIEYGQGLSYFEKCVLLAFLYFREQGCEYAVIEVWLGWRLDSTNIITPSLSIVTSISYDHMEYLGDTLEQNWRIAYEAWVFLGISEDIVQTALYHVEHHGRLEYILPNLLIDGAHNEDGITKLQSYIQSERENWKEVVHCFNLRIWKSATLVLDIFSTIDDWYIVESESPRVCAADELRSEIISIGRSARIVRPTEIRDMTKHNPDILFVVFWSLYMVWEFLDNSL